MSVTLIAATLYFICSKYETVNLLHKIYVKISLSRQDCYTGKLLLSLYFVINKITLEAPIYITVQYNITEIWYTYNIHMMCIYI